METQMTPNNKGKGDNKGNGNGWLILLLSVMIISNQFVLNSLMQQSPSNKDEEVVEDQFDPIDDTEEKDDETPIRVEPFDIIYSYGSEFRVVRFLPTDVLYVSHNRGDLTMMVDAEGKPITYSTYEEFVENREYVVTVESSSNTQEED